MPCGLTSSLSIEWFSLLVFLGFFRSRTSSPVCLLFYGSRTWRKTNHDEVKFVKKLGEDLSNSEAVIIGIAMTLCSGVLSLRQGSAGLERLDAHEGLSCTLGPRLDLEGLKEGGGPESEFPPLFHENPESRTFFITFPNPVFLTQNQFRATLNFRKFKVPLNPLRRIFLNFAKSCILPCWLQFDKKKMGVTELVFEL